MNGGWNWSWMIAVVVGLGGCLQPSSQPQSSGLANPASVYCQGLGYTNEARQDDSGGMYGVCIFPNGSECEEWDFLAGRCGQEKSFCAQQGYELREGTGNIATCVFPDGSSCPEYEFFLGECNPGEAESQEGRAVEGTEQIPVTGWLGYVTSLPDGAQFDDYVALWPDGTGEFGIEGVDPSVQEKIAALRDKEEPGKYAHFWGTLVCNVPDYGGCQLQTTRVRVGTETAGPEPVGGWDGKLVGLESDSQFERYFVLEGDIPVRYGIASAIVSNGYPVFKEELAELTDSGRVVRVWGQMICGVPDYAGCQIQVNRMEVDGIEVDPYQGWNMHRNTEYGFSLRYPTQWSLDDVPDEDTSAQGGPHYGRSLQLQRDGVLLYIGYRRADERVILGGTGMPAGEFDPRGEVYFLGQMLKKQALVYEGKVKALTYDRAEVDDLVFVIRVDDMRQMDYSGLEISDEIQWQVDEILGSFELAS
jgi:putative hemolysin